MSDPHPPPPPPPVMDIRVQLHIEQQHRRSVVEENCRIVEENNSLRAQNKLQAGEIERLSIRLARFDQKCGSQIKEIGKLKARLQEKASPAPKVYAELPMRAGPVDVRKRGGFSWDFMVIGSFPAFELFEGRKEPVESWQTEKDLEALRRLGKVQAEVLRKHVWVVERVEKAEIETPKKGAEREQKTDVMGGEKMEEDAPLPTKMENEETYIAASIEGEDGSKMEEQNEAKAPESELLDFEVHEAEEANAKAERAIDPARPFAAFAKMHVGLEEDDNHRDDDGTRDMETPKESAEQGTKGTTEETTEETTEANTEGTSKETTEDFQTSRSSASVSAEASKSGNDVNMRESRQGSVMDSRTSVVSSRTEPERQYQHLPKRPFSQVDSQDEVPRSQDPRQVKCFHCHNHGVECNLEAQCRHCQALGISCQRATCWRGSNCRHPGCNFLHPGQWPEGDERWNVRNSKRDIGPPQPKRVRTSYRERRGPYEGHRSADCYRP